MYFIQRECGQEEWPVMPGLGIIVLEVWWCVLGSKGLKEYGESVVLPRL